MPELELCIECKKPIYPQAQEYVVVNKDQPIDRSAWEYAHAECYESWAKKNKR